MNRASKFVFGAIATVLVHWTSHALAFNSGSTGADGALNIPAAPCCTYVDFTINLPASGILNYTSVNIGAYRRVIFTKNATNTPVTMLASGDVTIAGRIDISATNAANSGTSGDGILTDDGNPGIGGPGGFDGGRGGRTGANKRGGTGLGPGGGGGGGYLPASCNNFSQDQATGGAGAGHSAPGSTYTSSIGSCTASVFLPGTPGPAYGSAFLLPLIGGSGGGGGAGGPNFVGGGGGGGGGAILIASSGRVRLSGDIYADGGNGGQSAGNGAGGGGGAGSGGAVRIVATQIDGTSGGIFARSGSRGGAFSNALLIEGDGFDSVNGRIRVESETLFLAPGTTPTYLAGTPGPVFVPGSPSLRISQVGGQAVPAGATGAVTPTTGDVVLPANATNPVSVVVQGQNVPVGSTVEVRAAPLYGERISSGTGTLSGSPAASTATIPVALTLGGNVLTAQTTYTVVAAVGDLLAPFAENERVESVTLIASTDQQSIARLTTVSGRQFEVPADSLQVPLF